jgi:uncharacterized Zn-binding protein involved in type VI secretion
MHTAKQQQVLKHLIKKLLWDNTLPRAVRQGDTNSAGGVARGGASTVKINGRNAMQPGMSVSPHPCCPKKGCGAHCGASTRGGSSTVFVEGRPLITTSDSDSCGHGRSTGSSNVNVRA